MDELLTPKLSQLDLESLPHFAFQAPAFRQKLQKQLLRDFESAYIETKRSILQTATHIPSWLIVLLLVLGWNEFMTILRSPLYLMIAIVLVVIWMLSRLLGVGPIAELFWRRLQSSFDNLARTFEGGQDIQGKSKPSLEKKIKKHE